MGLDARPLDHLSRRLGMAEENLGARLKAARKRRKMTQAQLGRALGTSQEFVSLIEEGAKAIPSELVPMVRRFLDSGRLPTSDELAARKQDRSGR